jgi:hypothetical protein
MNKNKNHRVVLVKTEQPQQDLPNNQVFLFEKEEKLLQLEFQVKELMLKKKSLKHENQILKKKKIGQSKTTGSTTEKFNNQNVLCQQQPK